MNDMESHKETIQCPECNTIQEAKVLHTLPWATRIHNCVECNYTIMESEWYSLPPKSQDNQKQDNE